MPSPISLIFQRPGHEPVAEHILGFLGDDWGSILAAGSTCRQLNDVVTQSPRLQGALRRAYYQHRGRASPAPATNTAIGRMIDIERRWDALEPKRVHVITEQRDDDPTAQHDYGKFAVSDGVLVVQQSRGWSVYDLSDARDAEPGDLQPVHRVDLDFTFEHIAVSRKHNLLAVVEAEPDTGPPMVTETDESGNVWARYLYYSRIDRIHLFELFSPGWAHPQALKPVIRSQTLVHGGENYRHLQVSDIGLGNHITIAGDNIMIVREGPGPSPELINWRTGEDVMRPKTVPNGMQTERYLALADDTVMACGNTLADYDSTTDTSCPWKSGLAFLGLGGDDLTIDDTPVMERQQWINLFGGEELHEEIKAAAKVQGIPDIAHDGILEDDDLEDGQITPRYNPIANEDASLAVIDIGLWRGDLDNFDSRLVAKLERLRAVLGPRGEDVDLHDDCQGLVDWRTVKHALDAMPPCVSGHRVVQVDSRLPPGHNWDSIRLPLQARVRVSNYAPRDVHPGPLGSRFAHDAEAAAELEAAEGIPEFMQWLGPSRKGDHLSDYDGQWPTSSTHVRRDKPPLVLPRTDTERDVDFARPVTHIKSDSEHLYIQFNDTDAGRSVSRIIVLSF